MAVLPLGSALPLRDPMALLLDSAPLGAPMLPDPGCVVLPLGELGLPIVLPLGELGLPIEREDPVVPPEGMPLPGDVPPPAVWLWTNARSVNAAILTARNACHSLLFFIL